jgi:outer membrane lipoprotein SlyB
MERRNEDVERMREVDDSRMAGASDDPHAIDGETHATTGGAAAAGAVTGGVIGLTGGPLSAAIGAIGGAIVGVAAERMMHGEDETRRDTIP